MLTTSWRPVARYALAVALVATAATLRGAFPYIFGETPYLAFYPAVIFAAALGGMGPGLLATVLCTICVDVLFTEPIGKFSTDPLIWARQAIFVAGGMGVSAMAGMLRAGLERQQRQSSQLRESERKYRAVAEHTHDWEFWLAPDGRFVYVSPACLNVTGYPAEAFLADPSLADQIVHPDDRALYRAHRGQADEACATEHVEFRIVRFDGDIRWIGHACVPVFDEAGTFLGIRGSNRDITERKRAEEALSESRQRLAGIIDSAMDAIITVDEDQRIILFNPAAEKMFGCPAEQALNSPVDRFIPARFREVHAAHIRRFGETGETARAMGRLGAISGLRAGGEEFPIEASISQVSIEGRKLFSVILRDITERKRAEEAMAAAKSSAEQSKAEAEQASRAKDHFLAVLSHELRNPLTPVLATAAMLQQDERLGQETREHLEVIRRNAELEARLIDDLLDVTRITRGKVELNFRPIELCTVLRHAVDVCRPDIEARSLNFGMQTCDSPSIVLADPGRLQQVFWNVIKNAVKFTPHGGCMGLLCRSEDGQVVVEVSDSGVGIEPEALPRIFSAFEQPGTSGQFGGLGLGLAISKSLVEMHGGTIEARSEGKGKGSVFVIRLPLAPATAQPATVDARSGPPFAPGGHHPPSLRILLVEDHGDTARIMTQLLARHGHEVHCAGDIATALDLAAQHRFDLLLSDLGLPDGSGLDLLRVLRERGHNFPGIALSGYGQDQDIHQSLTAGFALHLTKPVDPARLDEAVGAFSSSPAGERHG